MGLFKTLFRYGLGTTLSKNHKELSGIAYATTMNYLEAQSEVEKANNNFYNAVKNLQSSMIEQYNNNKDYISDAYRDKYFKVIEDLGRATVNNYEIYTKKSEIAINELMFFSMLCSGAKSITDGLKDVPDDKISKANKLRVRKIVNEIWDTSSSNVGLTLFEDLMELLKEIKVGIPNEEETRRQLKNALKGIY
ncbi:MAG: hypothetical protein J6K45_00615 [Clostridia bacterium]|nr:hypothetical protein [Clostridia bacterium]